MAPTASRPLRVLLRRAGVVSTLLAVMAGIFGMHVMSGDHAMPTAATAVTAATGNTTVLIHHGSPGLHTGHPAAHGGHPGAQSTAAVTPAAPAYGTASGCADPGSCPAMNAMDAACVLSPANTSLSAPLPGTTAFPALSATGAALVATSYSYLPDSPSPCDLCISRT